jgi:hypothetical protein
VPLTKLQFKPGVNREATSLANEGGWYDGNNIRFRSGYPEKIGGWVTDTGTESTTQTSTLPAADNGLPTAKPPSTTGYNTASFWGICRNLWAWLNLAGYNLLGVGTSLKYYIQNGIGGTFYDITPIRNIGSPGAPTFTATVSSNVITVTDNSNGAQANDFVTFSGAVSLGGNITATVLNAEFQIKTIIDANTYTIQTSVVANSSDTGHGGSSAAAYYQITTGSSIYTQALGWGAGGWSGVNTGYSNTGWGQAAPASQGVGIQLRLWSSANYGQDLIINPSGGPLYYWANNSNINVFDRAVVLAAGSTITTSQGTFTVDSTCPSIVNYVLVSQASDFVIVFGCNDPSGLVTSSALDPLLIRWSDQQAVQSWTPTATNQAGSYRLSEGSQIVTAASAQQGILVWTDTSVYIMQYVGPPYVWGFQIMASNTSIIGPNATANINNTTYWMGYNKFYMYNGTVQTLPCSVRQYVFENLNLGQSSQVYAGTNEAYNEVWWFYPSVTGRNADGSLGSGTPSNPNTLNDSYVVYNYLDQTWYYGAMQRTAWLYTPLRQTPIATNYYGQLIYHENGVNDGTTNPASTINSYIQSSDFDIGDGNNFGFIWRVVPDINFNGSTSAQPTVNLTLLPRQNSGAPYGVSDVASIKSDQDYTNQREYVIQTFTQQLYTRARGRQMALVLASPKGTNGFGVQWQAGIQRLDIRPDGRR